MAHHTFAIDTNIVHGIQSHHSKARDLAPPIHLTSTFTFDRADQGADIFEGKENGYAYSRISNPTVDLFQEKIALLEGGETAIATASGMSAIASAAMSLAKSGDNFVSVNTLYGGSFVIFSRNLRKFNITARFIHPLQSSRDNLEALIDNNTKFLYIETPANPTLDIVDIALWASVAGHHHIPLIVDNTFASPFLQQPLKLGAQLVVHSATKYLGGHGDIVGGVLVGSTDMISHIRKEYTNYFGPTMSPFNAWLFLRGVKTLAVRMNRHCDNSEKIVQWLDSHPKVARVYYPGLAAHPGHDIAKKQMKRFGGMISFEVKGGLNAGKSVIDHVNLCSLAVSLGDCDTLIQHPASMTHSAYSKEEREKAGISDGLIRISIGIEDADDIIADLDAALSHA